MRYASVCSGVEAASLAWMPLGWEPIWFSEIEPFPCAVLKERFPGVQNLGDMTKIDGEKYAGTVDLLVGGTPCQGFSVAGKQGGLGDPRSALCLAYCRLLETMRPRWFVWENVPGVFSANRGEDLKAFLRKIDEIGYSCAWRVLDAQYIRVDGYPRAVPQRRRRVFVVGYLGEWRYPAEVLFEPGCLHRDSPPRREAGEETPGGAGRGAQAAGFRAMSISNGQAGELGCANDSVAQTLHCMHDQQAILCYESSDRESAAHQHVIARATSQGNAEIMENCCPTITEAAGTSGNKQQIVCYENHAQDSRVKEIDCAPVLSAKAGTGGNNLPLVASFMSGQGSRAGGIAFSESATVRRLLPVETERLMGFPDNWTRIPWRGKPAEKCPDSHRYKACGNSMCVNVMRWIGMRIENVERKMR